MLIAGATGMAAYQVLLSAGEVTVAAGTASVLGNTVPLFSALMGTMFLRERLTRLGWMGVVVSCLGATIIGISVGREFKFEFAALLVLGSALSQAVFFFVQKSLLRTYSSFEVIAFSTWIGALMLGVLLPTTPQALNSATLGPIAAVLWLAVVCSGVGFLSWTFALSRLPLTIASSSLYAIPGVAFVISWLWLGETPSAATLLGGAITVGGIALINVRGPAAAPGPRSDVALS